MPEFIRNFAQGKMNKDLDERLVPAGQYRDALNIEISTSEGSNVGALETLLGNIEQTPNGVPADSYCVGSIVNGEENAIYYLVAGSRNDISINDEGCVKDFILKYAVDTNTLTYVFVDIYEANMVVASVSAGNNQTPHEIKFANNNCLRPGMSATNTTNNNADLGDIIDLLDSNGVLTNNAIRISNSTPLPSVGDTIKFRGRRILDFSSFRLITGINIVDDFIMFTDDYSEPKKVNIKRSYQGTGSNAFTLSNLNNNAEYHTRLVSRRADGSFAGGGFEVVESRSSAVQPKYAELEDITVIKKSPLTPPTIRMFATDDEDRGNISGTLPTFGGFINNGVELQVGDIISISTFSPVDFRIGDFIILTNDDEADQQTFTDFQVRLRVTGRPGGANGSGNTSGPYTLEVQAVDPDLPDGTGANAPSFLVRLEQNPALFEFKFPRFGYRYKYADGEYSPFSPFSEIAFLPGGFDYEPKRGWNLGMANQLRRLFVENYMPQDYNRAKDIVEVDILYKEENSTTIYTAKTIKPSDADINSLNLWPSRNDYANNSNRGSIQIKSELIHAVVPSNQLIRPWDNVPRKARAQEVTGNRLLYANYLQNYNLYDTGNNLISPDIGLSFNSTSYDNLTDGNGNPLALGRPRKSVKSMRTYQLGVVYKDEFGRETPVLADKERGSVTIEKEFCNDVNVLTTQIRNNAPRWAKSFKFFIKETSAEYYNLAMHKWYNAEDGNIWLSFNSSDRNKVDIETFLELKKAHDSDTAVEERARYKIVAIENEAPEDLRIDRQQQGVVINNFARSWIGNVNEGFPFEDYNFITVDQAEFDSSVPSSVIPEAADHAIRIVGQGSDRSEFYDILGITATTNGQYRIQITKKFGPDVNFCSTDNTWGGRVSGLSVIFVKNKRIDKPEFDGKFFVKVYKDLTLQNFVLVTSDDDFVVDQAFSLRYLHTTGANGTLTHPYGYQEGGGTYQWNDSGDTTSRMGVVGVTTRDSGGNRFWHFGPGGNGEESDRVRAYIDEAPPARLYIPDADDESVIPDGWDTAGNGIADVSFFGSRNSGIFAPRPGYDPDADEFINIGGFNIPNPAALNPWISVSSNYTSTPNEDWIVEGSTNRNSYSWRNGPAGIYSVNGVGMMDVSIATIRPGTYRDPAGFAWDREHVRSLRWLGFADTDNPNVGNFADNSTVGQVKAFVDRLLQIGTKFKFRQDPDREVYTVEAWRGHYGILNSRRAQGATEFRHFTPGNKRHKFTVALDKIIGDPANGDGAAYDPRTDLRHDLTFADSCQLEFLAPYVSEDGFYSENPAVFETYPKENIELDIYYEVSRAYPIELAKDNDETLALIGGSVTLGNNVIGNISDFSFNGDAAIDFAAGILQGVNVGNILTIEDGWGGLVQLRVAAAQPAGATRVVVDSSVHNPLLTFTLPWHNCYAFGHGVESDRIRDDFNQQQIQNGVKASTTIAEQYKEERRGNGLIYSGIYNSISGVNRLNQFIQGEKITKDINPDNGTIQKLFTRNTDIIAFCEDKVIKILSDKDALFNADGNANVTATARVLGAVTPFIGDYGISKNPESFAADQFRCYFADQQRGAVLRLSRDGITPISDVGMKDYFSDIMADPLIAGASRMLGTFDKRKDEYNLTISKPPGFKKVIGPSFEPVTVTFNEGVKGWTSFKSFIPENGVSINNNYYTFKEGSLWKHHDNPVRNMFYGNIPGFNEWSYVELLFNDMPSSVKNFQTVKYEGTQSKINQFSTVSYNGQEYTDKEYYNLTNKTGWYVDYAYTDLAEGKVPEFLNKEGKWFNRVFGQCTDLENLDENEFQVQGIGLGSMTHSDPDSLPPNPLLITIKESSTDIDGTNWD